MTNTTPAAVWRLSETLTDWSEYDEGAINDAREAASKTLLALSAQLEAANQRAEMLADSVAKARAEGKAEGLREAMDVARKGFPILGSRGTLIDYQLVLDHAEQAHKNHYQSVERLAQRGGLSWAELHAVLHDKPFAKMDQNDAIVACRVVEARYLEALIPADTPAKVTVQEAAKMLITSQQLSQIGSLAVIKATHMINGAGGCVVQGDVLAAVRAAIRAIAGGRDE